MERSKFFYLVLTLFASICFAAPSHLLLVSVGDGAYVEGDSTDNHLKVASFLPNDTSINVSSNGGIESMMAGFNFRFGMGSNFLLRTDSIELNEGSILIQSRKIENSQGIRIGNEIIKLSGAGTSLFNYDESSGIHMTGILGRFRVDIYGNPKSMDLMPGDLLSVKEDGSYEISRADLKEVLSTSFLINGFKNNTSFENSLKKIATQQKADDVVESNLGENLKNVESGEHTEDKIVEDLGYQVPDIDPLAELLGRAPRRFGENVVVPISKENSEKLEDMTSNSEVEEPVEVKNRPFPSRLLRQK